MTAVGGARDQSTAEWKSDDGSTISGTPRPGPGETVSTRPTGGRISWHRVSKTNPYYYSSFVGFHVNLDFMSVVMRSGYVHSCFVYFNIYLFFNEAIYSIGPIRLIYYLSLS